jgi:aspartate aminotransferase/aminotransferase
MTTFSDRLSLIDSSGIRKAFDAAAKMKNPTNLGIGQPHFDVPEPIKKAAAEAMAQGFNAYTQTQGVAELIDKLKSEISQTKGRSPEELFITSGVSGAITLAFQALLNPGDEVILTDPHFVIYKHMAHLAQATPVYLDTYPDFRIDEEKLNRLITPKTKMIVLVSPGNPTGVIYSQKEIEGVIRAAKKNNILILTDEIYEAFNYDGGAFTPVPSVWKDYSNTLLLSGYSKTFSMTGWRVGFVAGPADIVNKMKMLQQYTFVCAPSFAQKASLSGFLPETRKIIAAHVADYKKKRDFVFEKLSGKFALVKPGGAFYYFIPAPGGDAEKFVARAMDKELVIIPGGVFSLRNTHFRLSFAVTDSVLEKGLDILNSLA